MYSYTDQINRSIQLPGIPKRIVSLVPSQTELLADLGLADAVVGITKFCVHPESWFRSKQRVGGTKKVNMDTVHRLQPDLIIANKEENVKEQVEELAVHYPVWVSDVNDLIDALAMIRSLGALTGTVAGAAAIAGSIEAGFASLAGITPVIRAAYLIWRDPWMTVGHDTFIHHLLQRCGLQNVFEQQSRYPAIDIAALQAADCKLLLLSSEPYPFKQQHIDELQQHLPATRILLVDGEMFSWYGSRLLQAPAYFQQLLGLVHSK
ncbi:helical backbone metal receptor [Paraflavitalea speifideaquila]|uniref:helical backbone metal receptor n=1 Tax=Paraflavitalea speifideaquila TaxID=3076558 RepID=UPI0028EBDA07|nr:helical backbone metal receptor [Paraflavitalea speifideiaquila]